MGLGIDLTKDQNNPHAELIEDLKDQLLIVFLKELKERGHDLVFPVAQIDDTGQDMLAFKVEDRTKFVFEIRKKS